MKKQIRPAPLLAAAILALSLLAGCADKKGVQDDDPVVASYGETEIRRSLVDYEKQNQQALSGGKAVSDQEAVDQLLENLAMLDEAEHLGLSVSQEEVDEAFAAQQQNYEEYEDVRTAVDAWCKQVGVAPDGYFAAIRDQLPRVILRQKLRDALGEAYCQAHGLTFTKVNPPEKMRDYVQSYLDGLLEKYSAKITYFPALNG